MNPLPLIYTPFDTLIGIKKSVSTLRNVLAINRAKKAESSLFLHHIAARATRYYRAEDSPDVVSL